MHKIIETYICSECYEAKEFEPCKQSHICPNCRIEMDYISTEEIDESTNKTIRNLTPPNKNIINQGNYGQYTPNKPIITCPYCQSNDTKKITITSKATSMALFGVFSIGKQVKNFHCKNCGSNF